MGASGSVPAAYTAGTTDKRTAMAIKILNVLSTTFLDGNFMIDFLLTGLA
jgi:hypothetical protein